VTNKKKQFEKTLKAIPHKPGIYKFIDKEGKVLYVGKAKDLKKRVSQYFQSKELGPKNRKMIENTENLDYIITDSELEALMLELNLIKELRPKYNILMKDDKNFVYIMITNEEFPRIQIVRKITDKKATYFGPKTAKHKVDKTFKVLKKVSPFRHCGLEMQTQKDGLIKVTKKTIKYPCLDYYIKRCPGPCIGEITAENYAKTIEQIKKFFRGNHEGLIKDLKSQMASFVAKKDFEKAAKVRDRIQNIEEISEKQKMSDPNQEDKDIINYTTDANRAFFNLFQVRDGKLINQENFILQGETEDPAEIIESFLTQYYEKTKDIPKEVLIPHEPLDKKAIEQFLKEEKGSKATLLTPQKGTKNKLLELSLKNAKIYADRNRAKWQEQNQDNEDATKELKKLLKLPATPNRIECYDISHLNGTETVGSMVVFEKGAPSKKMYRKFKIRTVVDKPDDYKSLEEVLTRRLSKLSIEVAAKDFKFKKAQKKDQTLKTGTLYVLQAEDKKGVGSLALNDINENIAEISGLYVSPKQRGKKLGHKLVQETVLKSKSKRIYVACKKDLKEYYARLGFEEIKTIPKELGTNKIAKTLTWYAIDRHKLKKDDSFSRIPELLVIDGGKGQLSSALKVLKKLNLTSHIPVISIAKQEEELFVPGQAKSIKLDRSNPVLKLIQRARDEAHRFAITYNRQLRSKNLS
jgi:excinuclease ABC subunit C